MIHFGGVCPFKAAILTRLSSAESVQGCEELGYISRICAKTLKTAAKKVKEIARCSSTSFLAPVLP
jgi:hypothetical protein